MIIALSVPVFFAMIGVEAVVARLLGRKVYRLDDAITDLGCGIGSQVTGLFMGAALLALYQLTWEHLRLFDLSTSSWWVWLGAMVLYDHQYYWWHRASHRINALWGAHIVHHQSQDYNLAVALRQAWFTRLSGVWVISVPLALLGVPLIVFVVCDAIDLLYQFWIHTRLVGRLGPLEWVLNTPSHHRVHHGINPRYIDKNYGGVFIVFDRLYGTFELEREEVVYGTVRVFESWNPIWANFEYLVHLARQSAATRSWADRLKVWVAPPEWAPRDAGGPKHIPEVDAASFQRWGTTATSGIGLYVVAQFVPATAATVALLWVGGDVPALLLAVPAGLVLWALANWGALFEDRPWGVPAELVRLLVTGLWCAGMAVGHPWAPVLFACIATFAVASAGWLVWLSRRAPTAVTAS